MTGHGMQSNIRTVKYQIVRLMRTLIQASSDSFQVVQGHPCSSCKSRVLHSARYNIWRLCFMQVCTTLEPLPSERYVYMKLTYTEDTPLDYEPPYFRKLADAEDNHFASRPFIM